MRAMKVIRIIKRLFPLPGLAVLDMKIKKMKRLMKKMEDENRNYYGENFYRILSKKNGLSV